MLPLDSKAGKRGVETLEGQHISRIVAFVINFARNE